MHVASLEMFPRAMIACESPGSAYLAAEGRIKASGIKRKLGKKTRENVSESKR
jgi:hypothetical protein